MWNVVKFMSNFPMPSQQTPEQRKLVNRYMRLWNKHMSESIRIQNENELIEHWYNNAFFDSWE